MTKNRLGHDYNLSLALGMALFFIWLIIIALKPIMVYYKKVPVILLALIRALNIILKEMRHDGNDQRYCEKSWFFREYCFPGFE